jgi:N-acetylmuramoyl-L-alanine amidase
MERKVIILKIIEMFLTKNRCFIQDKKIKPIGVMIHSDGCKASVKARDWFKRWNNLLIGKAAHFFIDDEEAVKYLHAEKGYINRGWHSGSGKNGSGNDLYIGSEMCEPKDYNDKIYFNKVYVNTVELTAILLKDVVNTTVVNEDTVLCHADGYKKGIASNHGDIYHWWKYHNKDMNDFRKDVKIKLAELMKTKEVPIENIYRVYTVVKGDTLTKIAANELKDFKRYKEIMTLNNMDSVNLKIGQKLKLPNK